MYHATEPLFVLEHGTGVIREEEAPCFVVDWLKSKGGLQFNTENPADPPTAIVEKFVHSTTGYYRGSSVLMCAYNATEAFLKSIDPDFKGFSSDDRRWYEEHPHTHPSGLICTKAFEVLQALANKYGFGISSIKLARGCLIFDELTQWAAALGGWVDNISNGVLTDKEVIESMEGDKDILLQISEGFNFRVVNEAEHAGVLFERRQHADIGHASFRSSGAKLDMSMGHTALITYDKLENITYTVEPPVSDFALPEGEPKEKPKPLDWYYMSFLVEGGVFKSRHSSYSYKDTRASSGYKGPNHSKEVTGVSPSNFLGVGTIYPSQKVVWLQSAVNSIRQKVAENPEATRTLGQPRLSFAKNNEHEFNDILERIYPSGKNLPVKWPDGYLKECIRQVNQVLNSDDPLSKKKAKAYRGVLLTGPLVHDLNLKEEIRESNFNLPEKILGYSRKQLADVSPLVILIVNQMRNAVDDVELSLNVDMGYYANANDFILPFSMLEFSSPSILKIITALESNNQATYQGLSEMLAMYIWNCWHNLGEVPINLPLVNYFASKGTNFHMQMLSHYVSAICLGWVHNMVEETSELATTDMLYRRFMKAYDGEEKLGNAPKEFMRELEKLTCMAYDPNSPKKLLGNSDTKALVKVAEETKTPEEQEKNYEYLKQGL